MTAIEDMKANIGFLVDQLCNSMEFYSEEEFILTLQREGFTKSQASQIWEEYWSLDVYDRIDFGFDWFGWIEEVMELIVR